MPSRPTIYPLTALRFFFALAVFGHHCYFLTKVDDAWANGLYYGLLYEGYIGVSFFFLLSGFILAYNYQEPLLANTVSRGKFYLARVARIYPLHLLTLLIALPITSGGIGALTSGESLTKFLAHVTLTQSYWLDSDLYSAYNSPSWSISVEMFFYLLFPLLAVFIGSALRRFGLRVLWLAGLVLVIPIMMPLVPVRWHHAIFYIHPFIRLAEFFLGILLFNVFNAWPMEKVEGRLFSYLELGAVVLLLAFVALAENVPEVYRYSAFYWVPMVMLLGVFAYQRGILSRWLAHPVWLLLGEISFSFYMIHRPVMWYYRKLKMKIFPYENVYVDLGATLGITLVASYLLYTYFERPMSRWVKGLVS